MKWIYFILICIAFVSCDEGISLKGLETPFEKSNGLETATYEEGIAWWKELETRSPYVSVQTFGTTDAGHPLHLVIVNPKKNFSQEKICENNQVSVLINNAIHPGEPDGVDASMLFVRDLLAHDDFAKTYKNTVFLIIPFYNVGGALNRNCCSRSNQNGPLSYGFRGNAKNLDLNRDFIKCDSKNAMSFIEMYTAWDPDVYLETHVSNGADYPYTMTYLCSQPDKLGGVIGAYLEHELTPSLFESMKSKGDEMTPYVHFEKSCPDSGIMCFYDSPRYSTGYTALVQGIGMLTETHMLKPFKQRVESTLRFMQSLAVEVNENSERIRNLRQQAQEKVLEQHTFPIDWEVDRENVSTLNFKGYHAYTDTSAVTGLSQLYYDSSRPWEAEIPYSNHLKAVFTVDAPKYYLVPRAWNKVIERLELNGVEMTLIKKDSLIEVTAYEIDSYDSRKMPYEGHYAHYNTKVEKQYWPKKILGGSYYLVDVNQRAKRLLIEVLEPNGPDSYFNWNFFDEILQQKEWFSSYVFDKEAEDLLKDPSIKTFFDEMMQKDTNFTNSSMAQLYFLYRQSEHYERERHMIYPVFRIE